MSSQLVAKTINGGFWLRPSCQLREQLRSGPLPIYKPKYPTPFSGVDNE